jgi:zinc transporter
MTSARKRFDIALLFNGQGGARELSDSEVDNWSPSDGILWVDCDQNHKAAKAWLTDHSQIDKNLLAVVLAGETRPRSLVEPDGLAIIMRGINMNPGAVPDDMVAIRVVIEKSRIITSHRRTVLSTRDVRDGLLAGTGPKTVGDFLISLTGFLAVRIEAAVENIEEMLENLDGEITEGDIGSMRSKLGVIRRQAAAIRRHLAPQRDALERLARSTTSIMTDKDLIAVRDEGDHVTRYIEDLDLARENALVTQEDLMNRVAQEQNSRMYLLSVVAAIFLPLTFVTGLLGMNVAGLPGTVSPYSFTVSTIVMIGLGFGLVLFFKWRKWI